MSRIWAVARHMIAEGIRMKVALVFIGVILVALPVLPFTIAGDGLTLKSRIQSFLAYSLAIVGVLLSLQTVFMSCAAISSEVRSRQIFMIASKPLPRWQFFVGKWVGICTLNALLLLVTGLSVWGFTHYLKGLPTTVPGDRETVLNEVLNARYGAKLEEPNWNTIVENRLRILREQGKGDNLTGSVLAGARESILLEETSKWRSLRPGEYKDLVFKNLLVDREADAWLHLHFKPTPTSGVDDLIFSATWQAGDRSDPNTLLPVGEQDFVAGRFHTIPIPVQAVNSKGELHIRLLNASERDTFTFEGAESLELLYNIGPFHWNLFRALLIIWCRLAFLAVLGLVASTFLSFPVACLTCFTVLLVASISGFLADAIRGAAPRPDGMDPLWIAGPVLRPLATALLWVVPDLSQFDPIGTLVAGRVVPLNWVLISLVVLVLVKGLILAVVGCIVLTKRELAQVVV